jgi:hypothetical protein
MWRKMFTFILPVALAVCASAPAAAQKLEKPKNWDVGDTATWNYVLKKRSMRLLERVMAVTDTEVRSTLQTEDRTFDAAVSTRDYSWLRGMSMPSGERNTFSAPYEWFSFPLEKDKAWSGTTTTSEQSFTCEIAYSIKVDGTERITVPAGAFDAFKLSGTEALNCKSFSSAGSAFGAASFTYWVATINGKLVFLKNEYHNSFGDSWSRELLSA